MEPQAPRLTLYTHAAPPSPAAKPKKCSSLTLSQHAESKRGFTSVWGLLSIFGLVCCFFLSHHISQSCAWMLCSSPLPLRAEMLRKSLKIAQVCKSSNITGANALTTQERELKTISSPDLSDSQSVTQGKPHAIKKKGKNYCQRWCLFKST